MISAFIKHDIRVLFFHNKRKKNIIILIEETSICNHYKVKAYLKLELWDLSECEIYIFGTFSLNENVISFAWMVAINSLIWLNCFDI